MDVDMTNSCGASVRNWNLNVVSRFWNPLALGPPGGARWVQIEPTDMPKVSVMRLEYSPEMSISLADGSSPLWNTKAVGSDSSSATHGSSVTCVAGKSRAPTKQWAAAFDEHASMASTAGT